jgi:sensor histidine kinase YesM
MGSYFSKPKQKNHIPFEALERSVEALNPNEYPPFERSSEWAKTRHIYSEQICFHEKYISWSVILVLFLLLFSFLYINYSTKSSQPLDFHLEDGTKL